MNKTSTKQIVEDFNSRFVNPYNFIPLGEKCERFGRKIEEGDCHTGYLECQIKLLTPLFIPNTSSSTRLVKRSEIQNEERRGYDFFSYDDWSKDPAAKELPGPPCDPVIPGSEIRGVVRSVYEAAFNGCMSNISGNRMLSRRTIKKETFRKKIGDLVEENGGYMPCKGKELCPACQIFGMLGKAEIGPAYAFGSKIRFTDAKMKDPAKDNSKLFADPIVLPELGEPRPSTTEFYTKSPYKKLQKPREGEGYWTYDHIYQYKYTKGKDKNISKQLLQKNLPMIRGRKYYWHSNVELEKYKDSFSNIDNAMKQRIRPMKPGPDSVFCFRIYFEQLSKRQLNQLKWALDFEDAQCAHKMGRAKPLGFGSVQISVDSLNLRNIGVKTGKWCMIKIEPGKFFSKLQLSNDAIEALRIMANWENKPQQVGYPLGEDQTNCKDKDNSVASHQWFTLNRGKGNDTNFKKILPEVKDEIAKTVDKKKALYKLIKK